MMKVIDIFKENNTGNTVVFEHTFNAYSDMFTVNGIEYNQIKYAERLNNLRINEIYTIIIHSVKEI